MSERDATDIFIKAIETTFAGRALIYPRYPIWFNDLGRIADLVISLYDSNSDLEGRDVFIIEVKGTTQISQSQIASAHQQAREVAAAFLSQDSAEIISSKTVNYLVTFPFASKPNISEQSEAYQYIKNTVFAEDITNREILETKFRNAVSITKDQSSSLSTIQKRHDIFINYRREDSGWAAGRLYDKLKLEAKSSSSNTPLHGKDIFFDITSIRGGKRFKQYIEERIIGSTVFLPVIGSNWLTISHPVSGKRRIDMVGDFVAWEIQLAMEHNLEIIPILVDAADMPRREDLPEEIREIVEYNARWLRLRDFNEDFDRILKDLEQLFTELTNPQVRLSRLYKTA